MSETERELRLRLANLETLLCEAARERAALRQEISDVRLRQDPWKPWRKEILLAVHGLIDRLEEVEYRQVEEAKKLHAVHLLALTNESALSSVRARLSELEGRTPEPEPEPEEQPAQLTTRVQ